ncbi:MAG: sugar ABC transporter substrate-binding protein [Albidovulum sp.]|nr:sugar ABC transporter substrate-binding protein [Albidovulum sp.]
MRSIKLVLSSLIGIALGSAAIADDKVVIGYAAPSLDGAQAQIQGGFVVGAERRGWQVISVTSGGDAQKQINDVNDFITQNVAAIVAVPDDSAGICVAVEAAREAGIPFYTIDRAPLGCVIDMVVLSDNYLGGKQAGEAMVAHLTEKYGSPKGTVLEITGNLAQNVAQLRGAGFDDVINQYPDIELIVKPGDWDAAKGVEIVRDVVSSRPVDGIYMHSDCVYSTGTVQTLKEIGQFAPKGEEGHIFIGGIDGCSENLDLIRAGATDQTSGQPIPDFGTLVADFMEKKFNGEDIGPGEVVQEGALWSPGRIAETDVGLQLFLSTTSITQDNVDHPGLWGNQ